MFTQSVEYALRAMVYLAMKPGVAHTTDQIAEATRVPRAYLSKVLQNLVRAELVRSQRGQRGGMTLASTPEEITILMVVEAVDPIQRIRSCPLGLASHGIRLCPLHRRVDNALATVEEAFRNTTLAEVISEPTESIPLCEFPPSRPDLFPLPSEDCSTNCTPSSD